MPSTPRPLIHIGFSKTATTYLQSQFFAKHPGISFLGQPATDPAVLEWMREMRWRDTAQFDSARAQSLRETGIAPALAGDKPVVISNESFTVMSGADRALVAQRLQEQLPNARILITIREQESYVESLYHALIQPDVYALRAYPTFERFVREDLGFNHARSHIRGGCFDLVVERYQTLFGASSVLVLPMERLKTDSVGYFETLCDFAGIDAFMPEDRSVNPRLSRLALTAARWSGRSAGFGLLCRGVQKASPRVWRRLRQTGPAATVRWPEPERAQARALFAASNVRLAQLTGLDLAAMGYAMP